MIFFSLFYLFYIYSLESMETQIFKQCFIPEVSIKGLHIRAIYLPTKIHNDAFVLKLCVFCARCNSVNFSLIEMTKILYRNIINMMFCSNFGYFDMKWVFFMQFFFQTTSALAWTKLIFTYEFIFPIHISDRKTLLVQSYVSCFNS